jgi:hypothetical protein
MNDPTQTNVLYIFLGAILTFLATALIEQLKNWRQSYTQQKSYRTYARLQLTAILKVLNRLKYSYESNGKYMPRDIALLATAMEPLNHIRNDTTILRNGAAQETLVDLIADINLYIADIKDISSEEPLEPVTVSETKKARKDSSPVPSNNRWLEKNIELIDLRRRAEDLTKQLQ